MVHGMVTCELDTKYIHVTSTGKIRVIFSYIGIGKPLLNMCNAKFLG